jgi:hypothetical protein
LTTGLQIVFRANHAPAAATTLLITLGGMKADYATVGILVIGITVATFLCDWGRRLMEYEFPYLAKFSRPFKTNNRQPAQNSVTSGSLAEEGETIEAVIPKTDLF